MSIQPLHITQEFLLDSLAKAIQARTSGYTRVQVNSVRGVGEDGETPAILHGLILELEPAKPEPVRLPAKGKLRLVSDNFGEES